MTKLEKLRDELANTQAKGKFLGDQLRLTFIDGFQSGFDKGAEEMAKIKDAQIEGLVEAMNNAYQLGSSSKYNTIANKDYNKMLDFIYKALENFRKEVK